jgi:hypothetical protein
VIPFHTQAGDYDVSALIAAEPCVADRTPRGVHPLTEIPRAGGATPIVKAKAKEDQDRHTQQWHCPAIERYDSRDTEDSKKKEWQK